VFMLASSLADPLGRLCRGAPPQRCRLVIALRYLW